MTTHKQWLGIAVSALAVVILAHPDVADAGSISSVKGDLSNRALLTIEGSGFGTKPYGAKPLYFWDWGSGNLGNDSLSRLQGGKINGAIAKQVVAPGSSAALFRDQNVGKGIGPMEVDTMAGGSDGQKFYSFWKVYFDFTLVGTEKIVSGVSTGFNYKHWRVWSNPPGSGWGQNNVVVGYGDNTGTTDYARPRGAIERASEPAVNPIENLPWASRTWLTEEAGYKMSSSPSNNDGAIFLRRSGRSTWETHAAYTQSSSYPGPLRRVIGPQIEFFAGLTSTPFYMDMYYLDDSWYRVVVTDKPVFDTTTVQKIEVQVPVEWSDTRVVVSARRGSLDSLSGKYLYVIGGDGKPVNTNGYALGGIRPNPPTAVTAN